MALRPLRRLLWRLRPSTLRPWDEAVGQPGSKVLVIVAHPDDELFCSGLICALAERGDHITIACLTRGEGGAQGDEDIAGLAAVREGELRESARALGAKDVRLLGYVDPPPRGGTARAPAHKRSRMSKDLRALLDEVAPDLVVTHGSSGEYWHPGHILLHDATREAVGLDGGARLVTLNAWNPDHPIQEIVNEDDRASFMIDVAPYREARERAMRCHASQLSVFEHFAGGSVGDFLEKTANESYRVI